MTTEMSASSASRFPLGATQSLSGQDFTRNPHVESSGDCPAAAKFPVRPFHASNFFAARFSWKHFPARDFSPARILAFALTAFLLVAPAAASARPCPAVDQDTLPPDFVPSGKTMFRQYCAACHGMDAKGRGPARSALKIPAPDLTTLAKRHGGEFPVDLVTNILQFGPGVSAHGSSDMPTWGPIFDYLDNYNKIIVQKRIKNLTDYLASLQEK